MIVEWRDVRSRPGSTTPSRASTGTVSQRVAVNLLRARSSISSISTPPPTTSRCRAWRIPRAAGPSSGSGRKAIGAFTSDLRAVEALPRARRCRPALALVAGSVLRAAVRVLRRAREAEEAQLADLHPGPQHDREGRDVAQLERDVTAEARVDEPCRGVGEQAQPPQRGLALEARGDVVGQRDGLVRRAQDELARVQDERLALRDLHEPGQVRLVG